MLLLLGTTITASFFDSLNPSAIAQQMLLQAMVKNKRYIWLFIMGIGSANFVMGLAIYYGIAAWVSSILTEMARAYPQHICRGAMIAGILCFFIGLRLIVKTRGDVRRDLEEEKSEDEGNKAPSQLSPISLFIMGAAFCAVELTSAFPYFGFLALLTSYHLAFPAVLLFIMIYNFMYMLPLILLYFGYNKLQGTAAVRKLEHILSKVSAYIVPVVISLAGILLIYYGAISVL